MRRFYLGSSLASMLLFGAASIFGWSPGGGGQREKFNPADVRQKGGYRAYGFSIWHAGIHGGK